MPAPATIRSGENDGLCSTYSSFTRSGPQTKSAIVFGASTSVVDLDAELLGLGLVLVDRVDEDADVVEERPLRLARVARRGARGTRRRPRAARRPTRREAERLPAARPPPPDRADTSATWSRSSSESVSASTSTISSPSPRSTTGSRPSSDETRSPIRASAPALARPLGVEERQLAAARVGAEQREAVGLLDHAHAEPLDRGRRPCARGRRPRARRDRASAASSSEDSRSDHVYFLRSTARCSCALVIFERPSIPMLFASS